jgi:hypothetical protein
MPRQIDVTLQKITCNRNDFGGAVQLSGDLFGETFQDDPNDPAQSKGKKDIFPFPNGAISLAAGQSHDVTMNSVPFFILSQSQDAPGANPKFLKIGGTLNPGLGSKFFTIAFNDSVHSIPPEGDLEPSQFDLVYESANLSVTLTFGAGQSNVF